MAAHEKVYGYCENGCKVPVFSQEQMKEKMIVIKSTTELFVSGAPSGTAQNQLGFGSGSFSIKVPSTIDLNQYHIVNIKISSDQGAKVFPCNINVLSAIMAYCDYVAFNLTTKHTVNVEMTLVHQDLFKVENV